MNQASELKPCPFCGGDKIEENGWGEGPENYCIGGGHLCDCGASCGEIGREAWNTRPIEAAQQAAIERQREVMREAANKLAMLSMVVKSQLEKLEIDGIIKRLKNENE